MQLLVMSTSIACNHYQYHCYQAPCTKTWLKTKRAWCKKFMFLEYSFKNLYLLTFVRHDISILPLYFTRLSIFFLSLSLSLSISLSLSKDLFIVKLTFCLDSYNWHFYLQYDVFTTDKQSKCQANKVEKVILIIN